MKFWGNASKGDAASLLDYFFFAVIFQIVTVLFINIFKCVLFYQCIQMGFAFKTDPWTPITLISTGEDKELYVQISSGENCYWQRLNIAIHFLGSGNERVPPLYCTGRSHVLLKWKTHFISLLERSFVVWCCKN